MEPERELELHFLSNGFKQEAKGLKADRNFHIHYPHFDQINQYQ